MTTLSARAVRRPRRRVACDDCGRITSGPHVRLYGRAHDSDPMNTLRICYACCERYTGFAVKDSKFAAALERLYQEERGK